VAGGAAALSLRGIAREMGMASSSLFRYFRNRDALLTALIIDSYSALADAVDRAEAQVHDRSVEERWVAICHGARGWAVAHPHEYALIFGSPVPGYAAPQDTVGPASRVPLLLGTLLGGLAADGADSHPPLSAVVQHALEPVRAIMPAGACDDLLVRGLMAWTYLFGALSFELFGHRHDVIADPEVFFDHEVRRLAAVLGFTQTP